MNYKGKISTSGTSEAIRFEKNLFRQHPEFKQQSEVKATVIGRGTMLVSLVDNSVQDESESDPIIEAFLAFLDRDMLNNPQNISPLSEDLIARAKKLTDGVVVSDEELE